MDKQILICGYRYNAHGPAPRRPPTVCPAGENSKRMTGEGCPVGYMHPPSPLRFLLFGSFAPFPKEKKERSPYRRAQSRGRPARWLPRKSHPVRVSFLWFFRSFPERKGRTPPPSGARKAGDGPPDGFRANPSPLRFLFFGSFFSFSERKERTLPLPPRAKPGDGPPDGFHSSPSPLRFLFFGSFFSFPERKERTGKKNRKNQHPTGEKPVPHIGRAWGHMGNGMGRVKKISRTRRGRPRS